MNTYKSHSDFWLGSDARTVGVDFDDDLLKAHRLGKQKRAIANFVQILTGQAIPVEFHEQGDSYTDGQRVTISSDLEKTSTDVTVGIAMHEASHIKMTDFDILPQLHRSPEAFFPDSLKALALSKKVTIPTLQRVVKDILNVVEDRRIDNFVYTTSPGYRSYYNSMYDKYWLSDKISEMMAGPKFRELGLDSYMFRIINFINENHDVHALPGLEEITNIIDVKNIGRLKNTREVLDVSFEVAEVILKNIDLPNLESESDDSQESDESDSQTSDKQGDESNDEAEQSSDSDEESTEETDNKSDDETDSDSSSDSDEDEEENETDSGSDSDSDSDEENDEENDSDSGSGSDSEEDNEEEESESDSGSGSDSDEESDEESDESDSGSGADSDSDESGDSDSDSSSSSPSSQWGEGHQPNEYNEPNEMADLTMEEIDAIKKLMDFLEGKIDKESLSSDMQQAIKDVDDNDIDVKEVGGFKVSKTKVIVYQKLTESVMALREFGVASTYEVCESAVAEGIRLGKTLGHKLKIRTEERAVSFNRKPQGKLDKRMIASAGFGYENIFEQTFVEKYSTAVIHISLDASSSMSGTKWNQAMTNAVAIAKAADMIGNMDIQISLRATQGSSNGTLPMIAMLYDSRHDKFSKILKFFPRLQASGYTPEGLCFEAVSDLIQDSTTEIDSYFINLSDGSPYFSNGYISYSGDRANQHTRNEIKKLEKRGLKILSYYVGNSSYSNQDFIDCYGKSNSEFIDVNNVNEISRTVNRLMLKK